MSNLHFSDESKGKNVKINTRLLQPPHNKSMGWFRRGSIVQYIMDGQKKFGRVINPEYVTGKVNGESCIFPVSALSSFSFRELFAGQPETENLIDRAICDGAEILTFSAPAVNFCFFRTLAYLSLAYINGRYLRVRHEKIVSKISSLFAITLVALTVLLGIFVFGREMHQRAITARWSDPAMYTQYHTGFNGILLFDQKKRLVSGVLSHGESGINEIDVWIPLASSFPYVKKYIEASTPIALEDIGEKNPDFTDEAKRLIAEMSK